MNDALFLYLGIGAMLIGAVFAIMYPIFSRRHARGLAVFALGAAIVVVDYFIDSPDQAIEFRDHAVPLLLGIAFTLIEVVRRRGRWR